MATTELECSPVRENLKVTSVFTSLRKGIAENKKPGSVSSGIKGH